MRILVTGAAGFIGSHITKAAVLAGHDVRGIDTGSDCRDYFRMHTPSFDAVIHCAAAVVTTADKARAGAAVAENLEIDAALFRWAASARPGRLVYFSSSCVYPAWLAQPGRQLRENHVDLRRPSWPDGLYGWIKLTGEQLAAQLTADGVPVTVVRPFSVYGPGMREGFAVSGLAAQVAQRADPLVIWGNAEQVRDFIHVTDVSRAVLAAIGHGIDGAVNLGTGRGTSLASLALLMTAAAGYAPEIKTDESLPAGPLSLVADNARLRSFCPPVTLLADYLAAA